MARLFSLEEIVRVTKGRLQGGMTDRGHACSVVIDSRKARRDCLFVALSGSKTNGHEYLQEAVQGGASICLVERREWNARKARVASLLAGRRAAAVEVSDTLLALQDLALFHLERFPGLLRIGITGSNGKTTTKEIVGCILSQAAETVVNEGNLNSETGLPLSAFRVSRHHRYAVFEMAMNHEGEMDDLSRIVKPAAALITNIGSAHIEFFGSRRRIALEKKKIFKYFSGKEMGFIHEAEPYFNFLENEVKGTIIPFGPKSTEGYRGSMDLGLDGTSIDWEGLQVHFPLFGYHNLLNALAAITLTQNLGVPPVSIQRGLENVQPLFGRSQIIRGCITIIQDCYNANPESMRTVLEIFDSLSWQERKIAVLGSMLELGREAEKAHEQVAHQVITLKIDLFFLFGQEMEAAFEVLKQKGFKGHYFWTDRFETLLESLKDTVKTGDLLLIKGSRGVELERLVEPLLRSAA